MTVVQTAVLGVIGPDKAGQPLAAALEPGGAFRNFTGAVMPRGENRVVRQ